MHVRIYALVYVSVKKMTPVLLYINQKDEDAREWRERVHQVCEYTREVSLIAFLIGFNYMTTQDKVLSL